MDGAISASTEKKKALVKKAFDVWADRMTHPRVISLESAGSFAFN